MIFRRLPQSSVSVYTALRTANEQNTAMGANSAITPATQARLAAIFSSFKSGITLINAKQGEASLETGIKNTAQRQTTLWSSHFLQTVILGAEREDGIVKAELAYYGIDQNSPSLPPLITEQDVLTAAEKCMSGEATRTAAGGFAIPYPKASVVDDKRQALNNAITARNMKNIALDDAQEALQVLTPEASAVVKKIWDEVETFYNEESDESRRANCRLYGVVYVSDTRIQLTGQAVALVSNIATPLPLAIMTLLQTGETDNADTNGDFILKTGFTGTGTVRIECTGYIPQEFTKDFTGVDDINTGVVTMVAV